MSFEAVEAEMNAAVDRRVFPGAVLLVREGSRVFYLRAFGNRSVDPATAPMHENTVFDLSSLTKAFATSVAMMVMVEAGKIRLDDRVTRFFHNFGVFGKTHITFRHLLGHSAGFAAWRPYYKEVAQIDRRGGHINFLASPAGRQHVYQLLHREVVDVAPGTRCVYSDLGFMCLGMAIEEVSGMALDRFCRDKIFRPLGLRSTAFVDLAGLRAQQLSPQTEMVAPTERCPWRKRVLCGEVHDENAYAMGGVSGHAGLFAPAKELDVLLCELKDCYHGRRGLVQPSIVREFWTRDRAVAGSTWCLGWDSPSPQGSSSGNLFSPHSVGHLGFSGTSVWLDLDADRHVILLSNRVHPSRDNEQIRAFRPMIHDLVVQALK